MIIRNLTDRSRTDRKVGRRPRDFLVDGKTLKPGEFIRVREDFNLARIAGWIAAELLCVGTPPKWYTAYDHRVVKPKPIEVVGDKLAKSTSKSSKKKSSSKKTVKKADDDE